MKIGKGFGAQNLFNKIKKQFDNSEYFNKQLKNRKGSNITMTDILMFALAMFSLKYPSVLTFDKEMRKKNIVANLKNLFRYKLNT